MNNVADIQTASRPVVSVIVTTFNRVHYLAETINSILAQTYKDFELIIVDNMSEDKTEEYVNNLADSRISYYRNPNYGVIAVNRNFGIEKAKGEYIALCDDDDLWLPEKLYCQIKLMDNHPKVRMCYSNAESFSGDTTVKARMVRRIVKRNFFYQLLRGNYIINSSVLIDAKVFKELGLLTVNLELREDYHMWLRITKNYEIKGIDESLVRYRVHIANVAGNRATETLKSIRTLKSVVQELGVPWLLVTPNIGLQYLKYIFYCATRRW